MPEGAAPTTGTAPSVFGWQDVNVISVIMLQIG